MEPLRSDDNRFRNTVAPLACQRDGLVGSLLSHATGSIPSRRDTWRKDIVRYLEEGHCETTRVKANPQDVSKEMRCLREENGKRIFTVEEFLHPQQICSFFSRMASKRRDVTDSDHEEKEFVRHHAAVYSDVMEVLEQEITHPLLFSRKNLCLMTEPEIKSLKMTQMRSIASHFSIKVKGRKKEEYSDAIIAFLDKCSCKQ